MKIYNLSFQFSSQVQHLKKTPSFIIGCMVDTNELTLLFTSRQDRCVPLVLWFKAILPHLDKCDICRVGRPELMEDKETRSRFLLSSQCRFTSDVESDDEVKGWMVCLSTVW